jgi:hypothetical protein
MVPHEGITTVGEHAEGPKLVPKAVNENVEPSEGAPDEGAMAVTFGRAYVISTVDATVVEQAVVTTMLVAGIVPQAGGRVQMMRVVPHDVGVQAPHVPIATPAVPPEGPKESPLMVMVVALAVIPENDGAAYVMRFAELVAVWP